MHKSSIYVNMSILVVQHFLLVFSSLVVMGVQCIQLPQVWVWTLQLVCTEIDSNAEVLGPPIARDIRTFPSVARFPDVENEQVNCCTQVIGKKLGKINSNDTPQSHLCA